MSVDLPEPFWPMSAWTSPGATSRETPSSALVPGNVFERFWTWSTGCTVGVGGAGVSAEIRLRNVRHDLHLPLVRQAN